VSAIRAFTELMAQLRAVAAGPDGTPSAVLEAVLDLTGYVGSWNLPRPAGRGPGGQPPRAGQRGPRVRGTPGRTERRASLDNFLEQVSLVADADNPCRDASGGV
jgi:hypothetical protein